jgi:AcrR family transcriptional regulator
MTEAKRPQRADALRNRERILAAAEEVFAARGTSVPTEEVARAAGVGNGTLFRHFPTKADLLEAVFVGRLRRLAGEAEQLSRADDPGAALFAFFTRIVEQSRTKNAFADALVEVGVDVGTATADVGRELRGAFDLLLRRAQQAGAVRPDLGAQDLIGLVIGASRAVDHLATDPQAQRHVITVILDGLRPPA